MQYCTVYVFLLWKRWKEKIIKETQVEVELHLKVVLCLYCVCFCVQVEACSMQSTIATNMSPS